MCWVALDLATAQCSQDCACRAEKLPLWFLCGQVFANALHAYILMVFCLFFGAADAKMITGEFEDF